MTGEKAQLGRLVGVSGRGNRSAAPDAGGGGPAAVSWPGCTPSLSLIKGLGIDGPLARTVADAALLLDVMTGNRHGDMYTLPRLPAGINQHPAFARIAACL